MNEQGEGPVSEARGQHRERRLFMLVMALGIAALAFGFVQTLNSIRSPFRIPDAESGEALGPTGAAIATLSQKDTDEDGLTDFDELYVYETSPYLADSDSDGENDTTEVFGGTNPNCPKGTACSALEALANGVTNSANTNESTNTQFGDTTLLSADDLREALRNAGAPATALESMSDEELLELYKEITGESTIPATTNSTANTNGSVAANVTLPQNIDAATLENLTPAQIREFLRQGGADEATLNQVDDETLRTIFEEALQDSQNSP